MSDQNDEKRDWLEYSAIGLMLPASIAVGTAIGYFLDKWLKTSPYLFMIFTLYGIGAGFYNVYKLTKRDRHDR